MHMSRPSTRMLLTRCHKCSNALEKRSKEEERILSCSMLRQQDVFQPQATQGHVLCCLCGAGIIPNPSNMCVNCLRTQVDIAEGVQKQATVLWCKNCGRYLQPPKHWLHAEPESKELLTFCLKKLKGLQKVKLVDAGFIWTEPHSRRLKVKITIQAEVYNGAILQQSFVVDYVIETHMCPDCEKQNANPNTWVAAVQLRQHTEHKRTFLYLEQLILKHNADSNCISIKNIHEGVDFFFSNRAHAQKFVDFLQSVIPIRFRQDKQLVSHNIHTSSYNYKYTYSVEIVPICRDDLICLPPKFAASSGNISPILLCTRVTNVITLTDPGTLRTLQIDAGTFFQTPFRPIMQSKQLREYVVLDSEPCGPSTSRNSLAEVQVARSADFGKNDRILTAKTHLGHLLHSGDTVVGYDIMSAQLASAELDKYLEKGLAMQDVILVRKSYEEKRRKRREKGHQRPWKLKSLKAEVAEEPVVKGRGRNGLANGAAREELDRERFMEELEEDPELRSKIAIYKNPDHVEQDRMTDGDGDEEELPDIPLEELLDDLTALQLADEDMQSE